VAVKPWRPPVDEDPMGAVVVLDAPVAVRPDLQPLWRAVEGSDHTAVDTALAALEHSAAGDAVTLARARAAASHSLYRRNRLADAAQLAATALELARPSGDAQACAEALVAWARIEWAAGNLDDALRHLEEAALMALPDARLQCHLDNLLGLVHADLGQRATSEAFHRSALDAARRSGSADLQMIALTNLAGRLLARGESATDPAEAAAAWHEIDVRVAEADALAARSGLAVALPHILVAHAASLMTRGEDAAAQAVFERQRQIVDGHPDRSSLPHAAPYRARLFQRRGDPDAARQALADGLEEARKLGAKAREASLALAASALEESLGDFRAALAHHKHFAALREECALESAHRKATALALRMQTARALREAADERQRAQQLAESNDALRLQADALSRVAYRDALTGLANRRELERRLPLLQQAARERGQPLCLVLLDVDHFKQVNDRCSHAIGDRVLQTLGQLLLQQFREDDLCARYGGEEFVIALPGANLAIGQRVCERLRQRVEGHDWSRLHPQLRVTVSQGVADLFPDDTWTAALARADARLYAAKRLGRNRVVAQEPAGAS
jgi:diguanylate cyclase (GGDEF)-like protein